ncbi:hypothetical protein QA811_20855 [Streptomyces sp. B21-102]|uniref:hypothetical protein n=1 Tax=Streptomyces sp. B21-102 TaxID=3039416 RepID=UPI002FF05198
MMVTLWVGTGAFLVTSHLHQGSGQAWPLALSGFLSGGVLILQYLVDFERRLRAVDLLHERRIREVRDSLSSHRSEMRAAVDEGFARISDATELFSQVDRSVLRSDGVTRLARTYARVGERGSGLVNVFAEEELARLASLMEDLSHGSADLAGENREWLVSLTECASRTIHAVSTSIDRDFWLGEGANRYLRAQKEALESRGVRIQHLFLVGRSDEITDDLTRLCDDVGELGIDVRIAALSELPPRARLAPGHDFVVFDEELCYEIHPGPSAHARTTLRAGREDVQARIAGFTVLWESAMKRRPTLPRIPPALPGGVASDVCRLRLTLLDEHPVPRAPARIRLRVQAGPGHPWSAPDAHLPLLVVTATPLSAARIQPAAVSTRPSRAGDDNTAEFLFTPELAGAHRLRVTVHDQASGTVLQQVETTVHVASAPGGLAPALAPLNPRAQGD